MASLHSTSSFVVFCFANEKLLFRYPQENPFLVFTAPTASPHTTGNVSAPQDNLSNKNSHLNSTNKNNNGGAVGRGETSSSGTLPPGLARAPTTTSTNSNSHIPNDGGGLPPHHHPASSLLASPTSTTNTTGALAGAADASSSRQYNNNIAGGVVTTTTTGAPAPHITGSGGMHRVRSAVTLSFQGSPKDAIGVTASHSSSTQQNSARNTENTVHSASMTSFPMESAHLSTGNPPHTTTAPRVQSALRHARSSLSLFSDAAGSVPAEDFYSNSSAHHLASQLHFTSNSQQRQNTAQRARRQLQLQQQQQQGLASGTMAPRGPRSSTVNASEMNAPPSSTTFSAFHSIPTDQQSPNGTTTLQPSQHWETVEVERSRNCVGIPDSTLAHLVRAISTSASIQVDNVLFLVFPLPLQPKTKKAPRKRHRHHRHPRSVSQDRGFSFQSPSTHSSHTLSSRSSSSSPDALCHRTHSGSVSSHHSGESRRSRRRRRHCQKDGSHGSSSTSPRPSAPTTSSHSTRSSPSLLASSGSSSSASSEQHSGVNSPTGAGPSPTRPKTRQLEAKAGTSERYSSPVTSRTTSSSVSVARGRGSSSTSSFSSSSSPRSVSSSSPPGEGDEGKGHSTKKSEPHPQPCSTTLRHREKEKKKQKQKMAHRLPRAGKAMLIVATNDVDTDEGTLTRFIQCFVNAWLREEHRTHYVSRQITKVEQLLHRWKRLRSDHVQELLRKSAARTVGGGGVGNNNNINNGSNMAPISSNPNSEVSSALGNEIPSEHPSHTFGAGSAASPVPAAALRRNANRSTTQQRRGLERRLGRNAVPENFSSATPSLSSRLQVTTTGTAEGSGAAYRQHRPPRILESPTPQRNAQLSPNANTTSPRPLPVLSSLSPNNSTDFSLSEEEASLLPVLSTLQGKASEGGRACTEQEEKRRRRRFRRNRQMSSPSSTSYTSDSSASAMVEGASGYPREHRSCMSRVMQYSSARPQRCFGSGLRQPPTTKRRGYHTLRKSKEARVAAEAALSAKLALFSRQQLFQWILTRQHWSLPSEVVALSCILNYWNAHLRDIPYSKLQLYLSYGGAGAVHRRVLEAAQQDSPHTQEAQQAALNAGSPGGQGMDALFRLDKLERIERGGGSVWSSAQKEQHPLYRISRYGLPDYIYIHHAIRLPLSHLTGAPSSALSESTLLFNTHFDPRCAIRLEDMHFPERLKEEYREVMEYYVYLLPLEDVLRCFQTLKQPYRLGAFYRALQMLLWTNLAQQQAMLMQSVSSTGNSSVSEMHYQAVAEEVGTFDFLVLGLMEFLRLRRVLLVDPIITLSFTHAEVMPALVVRRNFEKRWKEWDRALSEYDTNVTAWWNRSHSALPPSQPPPSQPFLTPFGASGGVSMGVTEGPSSLTAQDTSHGIGSVGSRGTAVTPSTVAAAVSFSGNTPNHSNACSPRTAGEFPGTDLFPNNRVQQEQPAGGGDGVPRLSISSTHGGATALHRSSTSSSSKRLPSLYAPGQLLLQMYMGTPHTSHADLASTRTPSVRAGSLAPPTGSFPQSPLRDTSHPTSAHHVGASQPVRGRMSTRSSTELEGLGPSTSSLRQQELPNAPPVCRSFPGAGVTPAAPLENPGSTNENKPNIHIPPNNSVALLQGSPPPTSHTPGMGGYYSTSYVTSSSGVNRGFGVISSPSSSSTGEGPSHVGYPVMNTTLGASGSVDIGSAGRLQPGRAEPPMSVRQFSKYPSMGVTPGSADVITTAGTLSTITPSTTPNHVTHKGRTASGSVSYPQKHLVMVDPSLPAPLPRLSLTAHCIWGTACPTCEKLLQHPNWWVVETASGCHTGALVSAWYTQRTPVLLHSLSDALTTPTLSSSPITGGVSSPTTPPGALLGCGTRVQLQFPFLDPYLHWFNQPRLLPAPSSTPLHGGAEAAGSATVLDHPSSGGGRWSGSSGCGCGAPGGSPSAAALDRGRAATPCHGGQRADEMEGDEEERQAHTRPWFLKPDLYVRRDAKHGVSSIRIFRRLCGLEDEEEEDVTAPAASGVVHPDDFIAAGAGGREKSSPSTQHSWQTPMTSPVHYESMMADGFPQFGSPPGSPLPPLSAARGRRRQNPNKGGGWYTSSGGLHWDQGGLLSAQRVPEAAAVWLSRYAGAIHDRLLLSAEICVAITATSTVLQRARMESRGSSSSGGGGGFKHAPPATATTVPTPSAPSDGGPHSTASPSERDKLGCVNPTSVAAVLRSSVLSPPSFDSLSPQSDLVPSMTPGGGKADQKDNQVKMSANHAGAVQQGGIKTTVRRTERPPVTESGLPSPKQLPQPAPPQQREWSGGTSVVPLMQRVGSSAVSSFSSPNTVATTIKGLGVVGSTVGGGSSNDYSPSHRSPGTTPETGATYCLSPLSHQAFSRRRTGTPLATSSRLPSLASPTSFSAPAPLGGGRTCTQSGGPTSSQQRRHLQPASILAISPHDDPQLEGQVPPEESRVTTVHQQDREQDDAHPPKEERFSDIPVSPVAVPRAAAPLPHVSSTTSTLSPMSAKRNTSEWKGHAESKQMRRGSERGDFTDTPLTAAQEVADPHVGLSQPPSREAQRGGGKPLSIPSSEYSGEKASSGAAQRYVRRRLKDRSQYFQQALGKPMSLFTAPPTHALPLHLKLEVNITSTRRTTHSTSQQQQHHAEEPQVSHKPEEWKSTVQGDIDRENVLRRSGSLDTPRTTTPSAAAKTRQASSQYTGSAHDIVFEQASQEVVKGNRGEPAAAGESPLQPRRRWAMKRAELECGERNFPFPRFSVLGEDRGFEPPAAWHIRLPPFLASSLGLPSGALLREQPALWNANGVGVTLTSASLMNRPSMHSTLPLFVLFQFVLHHLVVFLWQTPSTPPLKENTGLGASGTEASFNPLDASVKYRAASTTEPGKTWPSAAAPKRNPGRKRSTGSQGVDFEAVLRQLERNLRPLPIFLQRLSTVREWAIERRWTSVLLKSVQRRQQQLRQRRHQVPTTTTTTIETIRRVESHSEVIVFPTPVGIEGMEEVKGGKSSSGVEDSAGERALRLDAGSRSSSLTAAPLLLHASSSSPPTTAVATPNTAGSQQMTNNHSISSSRLEHVAGLSMRAAQQTLCHVDPTSAAPSQEEAFHSTSRPEEESFPEIHTLDIQLMEAYELYDKLALLPILLPYAGCFLTTTAAAEAGVVLPSPFFTSSRSPPPASVSVPSPSLASHHSCGRVIESSNTRPIQRQATPTSTPPRKEAHQTAASPPQQRWTSTSSLYLSAIPSVRLLLHTVVNEFSDLFLVGGSCFQEGENARASPKAL